MRGIVEGSWCRSMTGLAGDWWPLCACSLLGMSHVTDNETIADRNFRSRTSRDYRPSAWVPVFGSRTALHVARPPDRSMRVTFPVQVGIGFRIVTNIRADVGEGECDLEESRDRTVTIITRRRTQDRFRL